MKISIMHDGKLFEEIVKNNAIAMGLSISNQSSEYNLLDIDSLQFHDPYIYIKRNLPNGSSVEFLILEIDEVFTEKYRDFETMSIQFDNIIISAVI